MALSTVHSVKVSSHEDTRATLRAHLAEALHLARVINLVELQDAQLHLLVLVLLFLGLGVNLLFTLLTTTEKAERDVQLGIIRDTARSEDGFLIELATTEKNALVLGGDALASLDGSLDISYGGLGAELQDLGTVCT